MSDLGEGVSLLSCWESLGPESFGLDPVLVSGSLGFEEGVDPDWCPTSCSRVCNLFKVAANALLLESSAACLQEEQKDFED